MKFIYRNSKHSDSHWKQCERARAPFIELSNIGHGYVNIFYDITNYRVDLKRISSDLNRIHASYVDFFMLPGYAIGDANNHPYFFNLVVRSEHAEIIAEQLYEYFIHRLNK